MTPQEPSLQQQLIRPAPRCQRERGGKRRAVANQLNAVMGPRNLGRALAEAVPFRRRRGKTELQGAIFAAGVAAGRRQAQARAAVSGASPPRLRAGGSSRESPGRQAGQDGVKLSLLTHKETG